MNAKRELIRAVGVLLAGAGMLWLLGCSGAGAAEKNGATQQPLPQEAADAGGAQETAAKTKEVWLPVTVTNYHMSEGGAEDGGDSVDEWCFSFAYNEKGQVVSAQRAGHDSLDAELTNFTVSYDDKGFLSQVKRESVMAHEGGPLPVTVTIERDDTGRAVRLVRDDKNIPEVNQITTLKYNDKGEISSVAMAPTQDLVHPSGPAREEQVLRDGNGNVLFKKDPSKLYPGGVIKEPVYDESGRIVKKAVVNLPYADVTYDEHGNVKSIAGKGPGRQSTTTFEYSCFTVPATAHPIAFVVPDFESVGLGEDYVDLFMGLEYPGIDSFRLIDQVNGNALR